MRDILIVEDGLHERERLCAIFESAGYSTAAAESSQEAEQLLNRESFRLAVLDIGLSDRSGTHIFEQIKRSGRVNYSIILTGNPSTHLKQRFLESGAVAYLVKGSTAASHEELLALVVSLLGKAGAKTLSGIPLEEFLKFYVDEASRALFQERDSQLPSCAHCGAHQFVVTFSHKAQLPPLVEGRVLCKACQRELDPLLG